MTLIKVVILLFILLELSNVLALYFAPGSKYANAVGVFTAWEKSKQYPEIHDFVKYLVYWVAGTKQQHSANEPDSIDCCNTFILLAIIPFDQKNGSEWTG